MVSCDAWSTVYGTIIAPWTKPLRCPYHSDPEDRIARIRDLSLSEKDRFSGQVIPNLVGILDNCTSVAPKTSHVAMSLLSLFVAHRPEEVLKRLDVEPLSKSLYK